MAKSYPHSFTRKILHWWYCSGCGLVLLKNDASRKRANGSCDCGDD